MKIIVLVFLLLKTISVLTSNIYCTNNTRISFHEQKDIIRLHEKKFHHCINLEEVNFSKNLLIDLPNKLFERNPKLKKIIFSHNHLQKIGNDFFKELTQLEYVDFSYNKITYFNFPSLVYTKVNFLNIEHNWIVNIERTSMCKLTYLRHFKFNANYITCPEMQKILEYAQLYNPYLTMDPDLEMHTYSHSKLLSQIVYNREIWLCIMQYCQNGLFTALEVNKTVKIYKDLYGITELSDEEKQISCNYLYQLTGNL
uniref:CSON003744 protein n=1 Tax=Culicoides sonorensis TaxID=179676 RepID=A0A336L3G1_CULSO